MPSRDPELTRTCATADAAADARVARALRELPAVEPPADGWERVQRRLGAAAPAPVPSIAPPWPTLAVAASALLLTVGLLLRAGDDVAPPPASRATAEPGPTLPGIDAPGRPAIQAAAAARDEPVPAAEDWRRRSLELERVLAALPEQRVTRASTGLTAALLEDRIAFIDERLNDGIATSPDAADAAALWRQRALLMDSLVTVRYAAAVDPAI